MNLTTVQQMRPRVAVQPPPPPEPLVDVSTESPTVRVVADVINTTAAPFQTAPDPNKGTLGAIEHGMGAALGVVGAPFALLDAGFAMATAPLAALAPGLPAATLAVPHLSSPHAHLHPPSLVPPSPPITLPGMGVVMCAGCQSVTINGFPAARAGDVGLAPTCLGYTPAFEIFTGSSNTWIGGSRAARMGDITRQCNPASALKKVGAAMAGIAVVANAVGAGASAGAGDALAAAMKAKQAAADAMALALSALLGKDPGVPPAFGALLSGSFKVLIGGFPMPDVFELPGLLKKAGKMLRNAARKAGAAARNSRTVRKALARVNLCIAPGEPVNPFSGVVYNDFEDYRYDGFVWLRHYRSDWNQEDGPLGFGFRHAFDRRLLLLRTRAVYETHDGEEVSIPVDPHGGYVEGAGFSLTPFEGDGVYRLLTDRDEELYFVPQPTTPPTGRLMRMVKDGVDLRLTYDAAGRLYAITEVSGYAPLDTIFVYDDTGHVTEVRRGMRGTSPHVIARYAYDAGCLVAFQDAAGAIVRYRYDEQRRMIQATDRRGYSFHWRYDAMGRCVSARGDDGLWAVEASYEGLESRFREADGGVWTFKHYPDGTVSHLLDPEGGVLQYVRDDSGAIVKQILPGGSEVRWLYDANGKHVGRRDPWGHVLPPEDEDPNPPNPLDHYGPSTPREFSFGRPIDLLESSFTRLPTHVEMELDAALGPAARRTELPLPKRDAMGRVVERVEADGSVRCFQYDAEGNVIAERDPAGNWWQTTIGSWNLVVAETTPLGHTTRCGYTHRGECRELVDPNGNHTVYVRDGRQRIREIHRNGQLYRRYRYDAFDAIVAEEDASGRVLVQHETGPHGLHVATKLASGECYRYEYDGTGQLTKASSSQHEVVLRWSEGRLELDQRDGVGVEHRYGPAGHLLETRYFDRFVVTYEYARNGRLYVTTPDGTRHAFWMRPGQVVRENGNGTCEVSAFDSEQRLRLRACFRKSVDHCFWTTAYRYDATGRLLSCIDTASGPQSYRYDAAGRLIAQHDARGERRYEYDPAGNLIATPEHRTVVYDTGNLLARADTELYEHDERMRRARRHESSGRIVTYRYDSLDQLVEVSFGDREEKWTAAYDGLGRRSYREYGGRRTEFFWDGDRLAAERDPDGRLRIYVYPNEDALLPFLWLDYENDRAAPTTGKASYPFYAPTGLPIRVEDAYGREVWRASAVDPYGAFPAGPNASPPTRLRFAGHFWDEHLELSYNRFRDYDPRLGRYLQPDPLGHAGGINLYAYSANPVVEVDLRGLAHVKRAAKGAGNAQNGNLRPSERAPTRAKAPPGPPLPGVTAGERKLAAMPGNTPAQRQARRKVVRSFLRTYGREWDPTTKSYKPPNAQQVRDQLRGHDLSQPVRVGPPPPCPTPQYQWQRPGGFQGSYYTDKDARPAEVGIASYGRDQRGRYQSKVQKEYDVNPDATYLESTAAPVYDTWSVRGQPVWAKGGGVQRVIGDRSMATPTPPPGTPTS